MRAALLYGQEDLRVQDVPTPEVGPGEVLLAVRAAAVCGTDIRMYRNGAKGVGPESPLVLGHELSGTVLRAGRAVSGIREGQPVAVAPNMGCGTCDSCVSGIDGMMAVQVVEAGNRSIREGRPIALPQL